MKLSTFKNICEVAMCFDNWLFFKGDKAYINAPICKAVCSTEEEMPTIGLYLPVMVDVLKVCSVPEFKLSSDGKFACGSITTKIPTKPVRCFDDALDVGEVPAKLLLDVFLEAIGYMDEHEHFPAVFIAGKELRVMSRLTIYRTTWSEGEPATGVISSKQLTQLSKLFHQCAAADTWEGLFSFRDKRVYIDLANWKFSLPCPVNAIDYSVYCTEQKYEKLGTIQEGVMKHLLSQTKVDKIKWQENNGKISLTAEYNKEKFYLQDNERYELTQTSLASISKRGWSFTTKPLHMNDAIEIEIAAFYNNNIITAVRFICNDTTIWTSVRTENQPNPIGS
jgi:hypothetical protein